MTKTSKLREASLELICKNKVVRTHITRRSHLWFFNVYFANYLEFETAPFQLDLFEITESDDWRLLCLVAFRGSGKSTLMTLSFVLWSILGIRQSKFVLLIAHTQTQAKQHMMNIRGALEDNDVLRRDFGPFREETNEWGASTIVFTKLNARISVASTSEAIRGIKHLQHRPDLVLIDDPEDLQSARTKESRDKMYNWFKGEIMPIGSKRTRTVVIGNVLHEHCLVMRLKDEITNGITSGLYREYPLITPTNGSMWPGKYPTLKDIEEERRRIGNNRTWHREYLLKIIPEEDQIIKREWIAYYDQIPDDPARPYRQSASAVDLGIKDKDSSDPTAIVSGHLYGSGTNAHIYISPNFFNGRILFPDILKKIKETSDKLHGRYRTHTYIESVQAQAYVIDALRVEGYPVTGFNPTGRGNKEERLASISPLIQNGQVVFHRGCEEIVNQIVNFGYEDHDDLCDALVTLVIELTKIMGHGNASTNRFPIFGGTIRQSIIDGIDIDTCVDPDTEEVVLLRRPNMF